MHMDCKRKLGYLEETHAGTVRKKDKLHLEFHNHQIWSAGKIYLKPTLPVSPYEPLTFRWCLAFYRSVLKRHLCCGHVTYSGILIGSRAVCQNQSG